MSEVKRYEVYGHDWDSEENPNGFWVMATDYAALEAERDKLAGLLEFGRDHMENARHDVEVRANSGNLAAALVLAGIDQWLADIDAALAEVE